MKKKGILLLCLIFLSHCAGMPPNKDYARAKMAILSAEKVGARIYAPLAFERSKKYLKQCDGAYYERLYSEAKRYALLALEAAERAEEEALEKKKGKEGVVEDVD